MNFVGSKSASQVVHILVVVCGLVGLLIYVISMQDVQARRFTSYNSVYMVINFGFSGFEIKKQYHEIRLGSGFLIGIHIFVADPLTRLHFTSTAL
jgi:hypothetical protein